LHCFWECFERFSKDGEMKFPQFQYSRAASLSEAIGILGEHDGAAVPIAGGQSLLAGLSMRISAPERLVDIGDLQELKGITLEDQGRIVKIGALTRHVELMRSPVIQQHLPLLHEAIHLVGHVAIRNRGTFGGSLAYADPAAELPACTVALGGTVIVAGRDGKRAVPATEFFKGLLETALAPGELIVEIRLPVRKPVQVCGILELARRAGDFAQAGVAAVGEVENGKLAAATLVYFGCAERAKIAQNVSALLSGQPLPLREPAGLDAAVHQDIVPSDSPGCSASTKTKWAEVLTRRMINTLNERAAA
jgi:carbon-monoxide dehydrogenase medium subunit